MLDTRLSRVADLFPELKMIHDSRLRANVANTWLRAWEKSTWRDLSEVPFSIRPPLESRESLVLHCRCVARGAAALAQAVLDVHGIKANMDSLIAAALLHDVGKPQSLEMKGNSLVKTELGERFSHLYIGAQLARDEGIPDDIVHAIISHTVPTYAPAAPILPRTLEAVLVHYADFACADSLFLVSGKELLLRREAR